MMIVSDEFTRRIVLPYVGDMETLVDDPVSYVVNGRTGFLSILSISEIAKPTTIMIRNTTIVIANSSASS